MFRYINGNEITVVILTAYNWDYIAEEAQRVGVDSFLVKPLFPANVMEEFERIARRNNITKTQEKEKADLYAYAGEKFAAGLLEVIDSFERAMAAKPEDDRFADGMELILVQLKGVLEKNHVEEIKALGEPFDPVYHHAVMMEEAEGTESGIVTKVMQKGYTLNGKVIRPAMVAVSQ